ncbi:MAG: hypothetical protein V1779_03890 [bacterium]
MTELNKEITNSGKNTKFFLLMIIAFLSSINILISQSISKPYLAPAKDYTPQIYKYLFTIPTENTVTKPENQDSKLKKIQSVSSDSLSNNMEISYNSNDLGKPDKLNVTVKEKDKKINITIYNLIGNKVSDVYNAAPGSNDIEIENFKKEIEKLSNGVYICVLQGYDYRLMRKFTISR